RENRIGADVLPSLTTEDLKDLGINLVGDRRRLLDAIEALRKGARGVVDHGPPFEAGMSSAAPAAPGEAERRQLTVMFCDLVGVDTTVGGARSRGSARGDRGLPSLCRRHRPPLRWFCRQVHG